MVSAVVQSYDARRGKAVVVLEGGRHHRFPLRKVTVFLVYVIVIWAISNPAVALAHETELGAIRAPRSVGVVSWLATSSG